MTIKDTRAVVGQSLGLIDFDGSVEAYGNLGQAQQIQVAEAVDVYVNAHPEQFTAAQVQIAAQRVKNPLFGQPLADDSFIGNAAELPGALLDSAANMVNGTQTALKNALYIGVIVAVVFAIVYYGPEPKKFLPK